MSEIEELSDSLKERNYYGFKINKWTSNRCVQEQVKFSTMLKGLSNGYWPVAEFDPEPDNDNHNYRIDVGWFSYEDFEPKYAFEIDGTVSPHSVKKLNMLPDNIERVVISKSNSKSSVENKVNDHLPNDFYHIVARDYTIEY